MMTTRGACAGMAATASSPLRYRPTQRQSSASSRIMASVRLIRSSSSTRATLIGVLELAGAVMKLDFALQQHPGALAGGRNNLAQAVDFRQALVQVGQPVMGAGAVGQCGRVEALAVVLDGHAEQSP